MSIAKDSPLFKALRQSGFWPISGLETKSEAMFSWGSQFKSLRQPIGCGSPLIMSIHDRSRQIRFARLPRNALPQPLEIPGISPYKKREPKRRAIPTNQSPLISASNSSPISSAVQSIRKQRQLKQVASPLRVREAHPSDAALWGFSVQFSPKKELEARWKEAKLQQQQEEEARAAQNETVETSASEAKLLAERSKRDYRQYLALACKYGPLNGLLYSCSPFPGQMYALLVDQTARKLQRWLRERMHALRSFWISNLSHTIASQSCAMGIRIVLHSFEQQQHATAFLKRLRWLTAAKALRKWSEYTQRQHEVRSRFESSMVNTLHVRFLQWKSRLQAIKALKGRLKGVARRKRMTSAFHQWQEWKQQQETLRTHLVKQWLKLQRDCWTQWASFIVRSKRSRRAVTDIQRVWRGFCARTHCRRQRHGASSIVRVYRGWRARLYVRSVREQMLVAESLLQLTRCIAWQSRCARLQPERERQLAFELERSKREQQFAIEVQIQAEAALRAQLDQVVRNTAHQQLAETVRNLKASEADVDTAMAAQKDPQILVRLAKENLIREARAQAQRQAVDQFRQLSAENQPIEGCIVCHVEQQFNGHDSDWGASAPSCSEHIIGGDLQHWSLTSAQELILGLNAREDEYANALRSLPVAIPLLWRLVSAVDVYEQ